MSRVKYSLRQTVALLLIISGIIDKITWILGRPPPLTEPNPDEDPEENLLCPVMEPGEIIRQPWDVNQVVQFIPNPPSQASPSGSSQQQITFPLNTTSAPDCFDDSGLVIKILFNRQAS